MIRNKSKFQVELFEYLHSTEPLGSCSYCLGSVGILIPHNSSVRYYDKPQTTEELVDWKFLRKLEEDPYLDNGCARFSKNDNENLGNMSW